MFDFSTSAPAVFLKKTPLRPLPDCWKHESRTIELSPFSTRTACPPAAEPVIVTFFTITQWGFGGVLWSSRKFQPGRTRYMAGTSSTSTRMCESRIVALWDAAFITIAPRQLWSVTVSRICTSQFSTTTPRSWSGAEGSVWSVFGGNFSMVVPFFAWSSRIARVLNALSVYSKSGPYREWSTTKVESLTQLPAPEIRTPQTLLFSK